MSVAATNAEGKLASFSNFGLDSVHVAAPGDKIYSTLPGNQYGFKSGTSMAAPGVTGVAALVVTEFPEISNQELKDRLFFAVDRSPELHGKIFSGGHLNAAKAVEHDTVAPGELRDLRAEGVTPFTVPLFWRATGDDGDLGRASAYELRYSSRPITSEEEFAAARPVTSPAPAEAGELQELTLKVQPRGQDHTLYVAARAVDNVGQRGPIGQVQVSVPAANVAFSGDADAGVDQWTAVGGWGLQQVPGRGAVWTDSPNGEYALGAKGSITSRVFSLKDFQAAKVDFECRYDLEKVFDSVTLEVTRDGEKWDKLDAYEGLTGWEERSYDLTPYCGGDLRLRFRMKTDEDVCQDGFYLDKLVVTGS
ncbi:MAG: S8 family serine peptidase [Candidatus Eremiobacteraeota bacterium]|nr:S8 family serine peptidase [Candidatus Eremiobacteraeota bacterium]